LECRSAGRFALVFIVLLSLSCVLAPQEKPLNPKLLFTVGSSFLNDASSLALKGRIEFIDDHGSQSGGFEMFLAGKDSLSFLIEGPLGADVFRMIVLDTTAYLLSSHDEGWVTLGRLERASVAEYGIDNISPFETGFFALPQFYSGMISENSERDFTLEYNSDEYRCYSENDNKRFSIYSPDNQIVIHYSNRHEFGDGFYPAKIEVSVPRGSWRILLAIDNIRVNPRIPIRAWLRE
jgi:hypothetical protein